jgi:hypothetical protein
VAVGSHTRTEEVLIAMTDPMGELGLEQPVEDVLDQRRARVEDDEPDDLFDTETPLESNEADVVEQHRSVPLDGEDRG